MKMAAQKIANMKSVNIGAVHADMLPDVSSMTFDNGMNRKERMTSFLRHAPNPYCFCVVGFGVKLEFSEEAPSLQDALCTFLLRQHSGL